MFEEHVTTVETTDSGVASEYPPPESIDTIHRALVLGVRDYLRKTGFSQAVVGLSGGVDSSVVCCIATEALGRENVLGVSMPSAYSSTGSIEDARALAANLGIELREIPIASLFDAYLDVLGEHVSGDRESITVTLENVQARIRGNVLMALANEYRSIVLSTGNKSELAVGYCTLYGDMSGGLSVIADVPKTMVYELARRVNADRPLIPTTVLTKAPSAELRPGQRDQDALPPYEILDAVLSLYIDENRAIDDIIAAGFDSTTVRWVAEAIRRNEHKRRQAAPGLRVTTKAFGTGRRMPIAAKFDL